VATRGHFSRGGCFTLFGSCFTQRWARRCFHHHWFFWGDGRGAGEERVGGGEGGGEKKKGSKRRHRERVGEGDSKLPAGIVPGDSGRLLSVGLRYLVTVKHVGGESPSTILFTYPFTFLLLYCVSLFLTNSVCAALI